MILQGDCRARMAEMEENSIDAIVCDPPYELGFMGMKWDGSGIAYDQEVWRQAWRVLKPGGYLLAFGGTRSYHRLACAIEDAGFILHPMIGWCFGSGFPKATNLSKMIDRNNGESNRLLKFTKWMRSAGVTAKQINDVTGTFMGSHYLTDKTQPAIPTPDLWTKLRPLCGEVPKWVDDLVERIEAEREVIGKGRRNMMTPGKNTYGTWDESGIYDITTHATDAARQWDGWYYGRQSLKPSLEPICCAQKPPEGRMVDNVLRWGCGAINVDASRIGTDDNRSLLIGCSPYETLWAEELNLCNTCAKHVENCVIHIGQDQYLDFAIENARTNITGKDDLSQLGTCKLDIGCLDGTKGERIDTSLSTGGYGKTRTALSRRDSASTTSTEIRRITESKTCLLCGSQNTSASIREILTNIQNPQHRQIIAGHIERIIQSNEKNAPGRNASEGQGLKQSGRWPSNLILSHAPGCVRRGEKRVRSSQGSDYDGPAVNNVYGKRDHRTPSKVPSDETVADWDCVEGCAVKLIAEQSGHLKSGKVSKRHRQACEPGGGKRTMGGGWYSETKTGEWEESEGTAARFFLQIDPDPIVYVAKASRAERTAGGTVGCSHPTVKPLKLMRYLVRLVTPPGGVVLDPFAGSGTTLIAAKEEGFNFIGIELEPEYVEIAEARLAAADRPPATLEDFAP